MSEHPETLKRYATVPLHERRGGPGSAGQSGDTQGLSDVAQGGSESVQELLEEGQYFEAEVLLGVETAEDSDITEEVHTHEDPSDIHPKAESTPRP